MELFFRRWEVRVVCVDSNYGMAVGNSRETQDILPQFMIETLK